MTLRRASARILFLAAWGMAVVLAVPAAAEEDAGEDCSMPSRGRVAAVMTALFYHNPPDALAASGAGVFDRATFASAAPGQALGSRERGKVIDFAKSLVREGGYYPQEIYTLLGYKDETAARVARTVRRLDDAGLARPSPWEVAGRVGRSGMSGSSDHWAMASGGADEGGMTSPGTLAYLPVLAVAYAGYPGDGLEAAAQLAVLKDDDIRAASMARAAFSLIRQVLSSRDRDKDAWLRRAAADGLDLDTEHDLRAVRVKDWRYLRGEECAMGRLERAVFLWYGGESYQRIMAKGREALRSRETLAYLSALAAATYGQEGLPAEVLAGGASDRQLLELVHDVYDLATSEAVLRVMPEGSDE